MRTDDKHVLHDIISPPASYCHPNVDVIPLDLKSVSAD
jgi:hypothetical protein